jgi:ribosomal protein S18 acetylase RimI-like enzyme
LLARATWKHQHLDWFSALELLGHSPFYVAADQDRLTGCLACPPDVPEVAWIRLFVAEPGRAIQGLWGALWSEAREAARQAGAHVAAALPTSEWMPSLLEDAGFRKEDEVIFLERDSVAAAPAGLPRVSIRPLRERELPWVTEIDHQAFHPLWQLSQHALAMALSQSVLATVAEKDGSIIGYQITTLSSAGAHLARLAVDPLLQHRGVGSFLVSDALYQLRRRGLGRVSVNTQADNHLSQRLYAKLGFAPNGQAFPVYTLPLDP